ncbi:MAG TPA: hypothetical protein VIJ88_02495 [Candidatus Paceibacterota bacterium]
MLVTEVPPVAIKPLVCNKIEAGKSAFTAACFEGTDWSLGPIQKSEHVQANLGLASQVGAALWGLGVRRAYAPSPIEFNARIINPKILDRDIPLPYGVHLFRNQEVPADGTILRKQGDAGVFSAGGCSVVVATLGDEIIFAHAGRECVLDRTRVLTDGMEKGRWVESVVDNIVSALTPHHNLRQYLRAWVFYSIKPEDFVHRSDDPDPKHAAYNKAAADYLPQKFGSEFGWAEKAALYIDIPRIIKAQFHRLGVEHVSLEHAYLANELPHTRNGGGRYLVAIVRNS